MVEHERRQGIEREHGGLGGVIRPDRMAVSTADENRAYGVTAGIPSRIGIHAQQFQLAHIQTGFLPGFAHRRRFDSLADVHKTAG